MKDSGIIIVIFVMFVTTASQAGTRDLITQIELGQHEDNEKFWDYLSCVVKEFNQDLSRRNGTAEVNFHLYIILDKYYSWSAEERGEI